MCLPLEGHLANVTFQPSLPFIPLGEEGVTQLVSGLKKLNSASAVSLEASLPTERLPSGSLSVVWKAIWDQKVLPSGT